MIQHYIVARESAKPRPWDPANPAPGLPKDCMYIGKALVEMEKNLPDEVLRCYVTWDAKALPEYGADVIAILIGEEWGLIPRYARHVRMVARVLGRYPFLGFRKPWPFSTLKFLLLIKYLRNWVRHFRSWLLYQFPPSSWPASLSKNPLIVHLPWGSAELIDLPIRPVQSRPCAFFFSGGINTGANAGYRKWFGTPKVLARRAMVHAIHLLEKKYPSLNRGADQIAIHAATSNLTDRQSYAQRLMDAKVCLAPRGSTADTWRLFEGMKSGCVVIANPLPNEWYYQGAPVIQIEDWSGLEGVLLPLLQDEVRLSRIHKETLNHWDNVCGEKALGRYMAQQLARVSQPATTYCGVSS